MSLKVKQTLLHFVIAFFITVGVWHNGKILQSYKYNALFLPISLVENSVSGSGNSRGNGTTSNGIPYYDEHELQLYMHNRRTLLMKNESSIMKLGWKGGPVPMGFFSEIFGEDLVLLKSWWEVSTWDASAREEYLNPFSVTVDTSSSSSSTLTRDLLVGSPRIGSGVCDAIKTLRATKNGGVKRHVLIADINENWGAFSDPVTDRTMNGAGWIRRLKWSGCDMSDFWSYLNHSNVSAIFTTTHQSLDHPKVISIPLGVLNSREVAKQLHAKPMMVNRTQLLLIAQSDWQHRSAITERVIANFNGTIQNRNKDGSNYWENLRTSKFILSPSGMGWDCYRTWEALVMGAIPVLETYARQDGLYRTYADLPVLWVDHYDNVTPTLLEESYPKIVSKAREYNFEKLTKEWWVNLINSYRAQI